MAHHFFDAVHPFNGLPNDDAARATGVAAGQQIAADRANASDDFFYFLQRSTAPVQQVVVTFQGGSCPGALVELRPRAAPGGEPLGSVAGAAALLRRNECCDL